MCYNFSYVCGMEESKIKCNWCGWTGFEDDLIINHDTEHCPDCNREDALMDVEPEKHTQ